MSATNHVSHDPARPGGRAEYSPENDDVPAAARTRPSPGRAERATSHASSHRLRAVYFALAAGWGFIVGVTGLAIALRSSGTDPTLGAGVVAVLAVAAAAALAGGGVAAAAYREAKRRRRF